jgi:hypothetical protein
MVRLLSGCLHITRQGSQWGSKDCQFQYERFKLMEHLNNFELDILTRAAKTLPELQRHIPNLRIQHRRITGVGMYIDFVYINQNDDDLLGIPPINGPIEGDKIIEIPSLQYGLGYEIEITKGKVSYIEVYSFDEPWDGTLENYSIRPL